MLLVLAALACSSVAPPAPAPPEPEPAPAVASIAGVPILPSPVVMGGLSAADADAGVAGVSEALHACSVAGREDRAGLMGKLLVKLVVDKEGAVSRAAIEASSLRHPATEACAVAALQEARFPALAAGELAIVRYPLTFPR